MKVPKNIMVVVGVVIVVLLLLGAVFVLGVGVWRLAKSEKQLGKLKGQWKEFYQKSKPFPSRENVLKEKENNQTIDNWFSKLMKALRKHQVEPENKSPSMFKGVLDEKRNKMLALARESDKDIVKSDFAFGFSRYLASGNLPAPENVPTLTQQLLIIEDLFGLLVESNVKEVLAIEREEFDAAGGEGDGHGFAPLPPGMPGLSPGPQARRPGAIEGESLYGKLHFVFEFRAKESAVWDALNRLANHGMIVVVTSVQLDSEGPDVLKMIGAGAGEAAKGPGAEAVEDEAQPRRSVTRKTKKPEAAVAPKAEEEKKIPTRQERVVSGPTKAFPVKARVEVDVYRFKGE